MKAVRVESQNPVKKRYLTVVSSEVDHSAIIGIDWSSGEGWVSVKSYQGCSHTKRETEQYIGT